MRWLKVTIATLLITILLISLVFFARKPLVSYTLNHYLLTDEAQLSCIDFHLTSSLNIVISKACISTPQADIAIINTGLQLSSSFQVTAINIEGLTINAKAKLLGTNNTTSTLITADVFQHYLAKVAQVSLPLPITIEELTYQPFYQQKHTATTLYYGQLNAVNKTIEFALRNSKKAHIVCVELIANGDNFTAKLNTDLSQLTQFLSSHQLSLPANIAKRMAVSGVLSTQLQWQNETLTASSILNDFSLDSPEVLAQTGLININGMLSWLTTITANTAVFTIDEQSVIKSNVNNQQLLDYLSTKNISDSIISFIKANPINGLVINPQGIIKAEFNKQQALISKLEFTLNNAASPLKISVTDTLLTYQTKHSIRPKLNHSNYSIDANLRIKALQPLTNMPVKITALGTIKESDLGWKISVSPNTKLELSKLALPSPNTNSANTKSQKSTAINNIVSIEKLITNAQGKVSIDPHGLADVSLQLDSYASTLHVTNLALIKQLEVKSKFTGNLQNIDITANAIADGVTFANINISGDIAQPKFDINAHDLALTDLLSLTLNLPIDISLIDGRVSYQLLGQFTDSSNWLNNSANLSLSIQALTGEIEDTWIQSLNWQQRLVLGDGDLKSTHDDNTVKDNLTIAKIEIAPPLTNLSAQTTLDLENEQLNINLNKVNAELLGGSVFIANAQVPFLDSRSVDVKLTRVDLEELLALDPKQGIIVTGKISGNLPVSTNGKKFTISDGELHNVTNGIIKVANNPAVEQLKKNDPQLKLAFDAMQNIHYHQLSSKVSMANDGYMIFDTIIRGRNPDIDNDVNLNLNLSYDLLGLLESLNITKELEQQLIDRLQKTKEHL